MEEDYITYCIAYAKGVRERDEERREDECYKYVNGFFGYVSKI